MTGIRRLVVELALIMGEHSPVESQYYAPAAHLRLVVVPATGHDLALSTTAPLTDAIMIGWALAAAGPRSVLSRRAVEVRGRRVPVS